MPSYYIATDRFGNYDLAHHGIMGQKWGVRRYQDKNGSLTEAGKKHYSRQIDRRIDKRISYVSKYKKKNRRLPKSEADIAREKIFLDFADSKENKDLKAASEKYESFEREMHDKYYDAKKKGHQYFDVYSKKDFEREQKLRGELNKCYASSADAYIRLIEKNKPGITSAYLKDISVTDLAETRKMVENNFSKRYGPDWWRYVH